MTTGGEELPRRGEVWRVRVDTRRPRVRSFLVVPLTSRLHLEGLPGTVRLDRGDTGLLKPSVANVYGPPDRPAVGRGHWPRFGRCSKTA